MLGEPGGAPAGGASASGSSAGGPAGGGAQASSAGSAPRGGGNGNGPAARLTVAGGSGAAPSVRSSEPARMTVAPDPSARAEPQRPAMELSSFEAVVELVAARRDIGLKLQLERHVRLVRFEDGRIEINPTRDANPNLSGDLGRKLTEWTGRRWIVAVSRDEGAATLQETKDAKRRSLVDDARADPAVAAILARFPGAEIVDVRLGEGDTAADGAPAPFDDVPFDPDAYDLDAAFGEPFEDD
ncbi:DNA polymerase III subunits gamma and tau [Methylobrevis pamukkalensis]|uniref:DNA polymerase III subunits gamma and tau n=1 Tax=Methylobrevis pamukkalensis TaxID=1439726 RepID=A0A1E3H2H3_9HYPH|nr:DNA polymerase III subunits gamma and tau [Methylobrevis pamukkalensis]